MAFVNNSFNAAKKIKLERTDFSVELTAPFSEGEEVAKILSLTTSVCDERTEMVAGEMLISGKVLLNALYLTSAGEIGSTSSVCPFNSKVSSPHISASVKSDVNLKIVDCKMEGMSVGSLKAIVMLEAAPILTVSEERKFIREGDADICTKEDDANVVLLLGEVRTVSNHENELMLKESIKKLLHCEHSVNLKEAAAGVNFVSVSGEIFTHVLYISEADKCEQAQLTTSFKEEIEFENMTREGIVESVLKLKSSEAKTSIEITDKGTKLIFNVPVDVMVRGYKEEKVQVCFDMYSLTHELKLTTESYEYVNILKPCMFDTKIEGSLTLSESMPRVDKILTNGGSRLVVSNSYVKEGEIYIEGIAYTNVVYLCDEENSVNSVEVEIPFVVSERTDSEEELIMLPNCVLSDVDVAVKKGREILFDAKLKAVINMSSKSIGAVISDAEVKEPLAQRTHAMEIYFAKANQEVWEIAKELKIKTGMIAYQNPNIAFPLEKDENIIVYHQKTTNM